MNLYLDILHKHQKSFHRSLLRYELMCLCRGLLQYKYPEYTVIELMDIVRDEYKLNY